MSENVRSDSTSAGLTRRNALKLGSATAGGLLLTGLMSNGDASAAEVATATTASEKPNHLPVKAIEAIIGAQGTVSDGVLNIEIDRDDVKNVRNSAGYPIKPAFQVNGNVVFQSAGDHDHDSDDIHGKAILNGDLPFLAHEVQPAIDQMLKHGIVLQAMHQHFYDWNPMVWFMHFRAHGNPRTLARGVAAILKTTSIPLPQTSPSNPKTPLDTKRLAKIIGSSPTVGADGVVSFEVPRKHAIHLGGDRINRYLNVATTVAFEPLSSTTAVAVDFGMITHETQAVIKVMRTQGWQVGCLYNQETGESPQLFWAHHFKAGDAYQLAHEVRHGLNHMDLSFT
jgi:hypothetical protein